jgi:predicted O-linked N-acetylglucosamine transferase (SPINDLY family)
MPDSDAQLSLAQQLMHQSRFGEAEAGLREVLTAHPSQHDARYLLGCALFQLGRTGEAVQTLDRAAVDSGLAEHRSALATVLFHLGRDEEAEQNLRKAIALDASTAHYHSGLGAVLQRQGRTDQAIESFEKAVELGECSDDTRLTLGRLHASVGDDPAALRQFIAILKSTPDQAAGLAAARRILRGAVPADSLMREAMAAQGGSPAKLCRLAAGLQKSGDAAGAREVAQAAAALAPESPDAWFCLGFVESENDAYLEAIDCFNRVLDKRPDWIEARHNLARALFEIGQVEESYREFQRCTSGPREIAARARAMMAVIAPGVPGADHKEVLRIRRAWASTQQRGRDDNSQDVFTFAGDAGRDREPGRLRIGYLSSFFHRDNWMKPVWGLINAHDHEAFDIVLFSDAAQEEMGSAYRPHARDAYVDIRSLDTSALREAIRRNAVDVLVDLNGYSEMNRAPLFAEARRTRRDPVTVAWFNQYATSALDGFDYLIGDASVIDKDEEQFYTEKVLRVSGSYLTFTADADAPPVSDLPWLRDGAAGITFGCLCSQYKITNEVIVAWSRILRESPAGSTLLLKNKQLGSEGMATWIRGLFAEHGISGERIRTEGPEAHHAFLNAYSRIDLALDVFPYNGGTTTTEALWQGVPVLTFHGDRWASRTSESLLRAAGLDEFVAPDLEGFIAHAIRLARDPESREYLAAARRGMRAKLLASPVCNSSRLAREMEELYRYCRRSRSA